MLCGGNGLGTIKTIKHSGSDRRMKGSLRIMLQTIGMTRDDEGKLKS